MVTEASETPEGSHIQGSEREKTSVKGDVLRGAQC